LELVNGLMVKERRIDLDHSIQGEAAVICAKKNFFASWGEKKSRNHTKTPPRGAVVRGKRTGSEGKRNFLLQVERKGVRGDAVHKTKVKFQSRREQAGRVSRLKK